MKTAWKNSNGRLTKISFEFGVFSMFVSPNRCAQWAAAQRAVIRIDQGKSRWVAGVGMLNCTRDWGEHQRAPQSGVELEICHSRYMLINNIHRPRVNIGWYLARAISRAKYQPIFTSARWILYLYLKSAKRKLHGWLLVNFAKFSFLFFCCCFSRVTICTLALPTLAFDRAILLAHGPIIGNFTCALWGVRAHGKRRASSSRGFVFFLWFKKKDGGKRWARERERSFQSCRGEWPESTGEWSKQWGDEES